MSLNMVTQALGFILLMIFLMFALALLLFAFWIWMIVDCAKRRFKNDNEKIVWILVLIFLALLGAVIYYFAVKLQDNGKVKK